MSNEEMVKEAVEEAKKAAEQQEDKETEETVEETVEESAEETVEEATEESAEETEETTEDEKKSFFKRKPKKDKKDEQIEELTDKVKRQMAEFDNYRKRTEKEKSSMYEVGAKDVIEKILPVVDSIERGLTAVPEDKKDDSFVAGMEKIYKQLMTTLEGIGVKPIEAVGKEFNPNFHNAVMHEDNDEYEDNINMEEYQKG